MSNLYVVERRDWRGDVYRAAKPDEVLAELREGVESGTIKGEAVWRCATHRSDASVPPSDDGWVSCWYAANHLAYNPRAHMEPCRIVETLVIPVSDGGSET